MMINETQAQAIATNGRGGGQYPSGLHDDTEINTAADEQAKAEVSLTMEVVITRENLMLAYQRVVENRGTAGVNNLNVAELKPWLKKSWRSVGQALIDGNYQPRTVRRMDIPKPDGDVRISDIPTMVDRLIQQAVQQAQRYTRDGKRWMMDMDLEKFFDRMGHRPLMTRLARTIKDRRVLWLMRRYLKAEMVKDRQGEKRQTGMLQGGSLSPLLSSTLLDELDRELERRGHDFCRYADDCNVCVSNWKTGDYLLKNIRAFVGSKLKVNEKKSAVAHP